MFLCRSAEKSLLPFIDRKALQVTELPLHAYIGILIMWEKSFFIFYIFFSAVAATATATTSNDTTTVGHSAASNVSSSTRIAWIVRFTCHTAVCFASSSIYIFFCISPWEQGSDDWFYFLFFFVIFRFLDGTHCTSIPDPILFCVHVVIIIKIMFTNVLIASCTPRPPSSEIAAEEAAAAATTVSAAIYYLDMLNGCSKYKMCLPYLWLSIISEAYQRQKTKKKRKEKRREKKGNCFWYLSCALPEVVESKV